MEFTKNPHFDLRKKAVSSTIPTRILTSFLFGVQLLSPVSFFAAPSTIQSSDSQLTISRRKIVLVRPPDVVKHFPNRKTAVVVYPVISGLSDRQLLQKVRALLRIENIFEYSLNDYRKDQWLTEFSYKVNYNRNYVFDITFTQSGAAAYPDTQTKHMAIDLKRGALIKATDVFQSDSFQMLAAIVDRKLQEELRQISARAKVESELDQADKNSIIEALNDMVFETRNLDEFSVSSNGLTFLYDAGFPYVMEAFEPRGQYFVPYSELKPYIKSESLLAQFVR